MACENLMFKLDQQHDLQKLTQNGTVNVRKTVTLLCACVTIVDVEKQ